MTANLTVSAKAVHHHSIPLVNSPQWINFHAKSTQYTINKIRRIRAVVVGFRLL
jgi:hypothetical protein